MIISTYNANREREQTHTYTNHKHAREKQVFGRELCLRKKKESSSSRKRENAIESFERKANTKHPTRFYFMTIDRSNRRRKMQNFTAKRVVISIFYQLTQQDYLKTLILTHVHTHSPSGKKKKKVKTSKQASKREEIIDKQKEM